MSRIIANAVIGAWVLGATVVSAAATTQQARMEDYQEKLEDRIEERVESYRQRRLREERAEVAGTRDDDVTWTRRGQERELDESVPQELTQPFESVVNVYSSNSGEGQDVEIRLTMPVDEFMEFAPIAALEAAAIPHKFPVVYIFVREEKTDRVARVAFKDAEPIAGRYLANDEDAVEEMKEALIWH